MSHYRYGSLYFTPYAEGNDEFIESFDGFSSRLQENPITGHMQFNPMPSSSLLTKYYNGSFTRSVPGATPKPENEFTPQVIDVVIALKGYLQAECGMPEKFTYHDIGCGFGAGVWGFQQQGIKATGNEANEVWVNAANPYCNYALSSEPLEKALEALGYKIDVFFTAHVLEHLPDPIAVMKTVAAHLSDNGVLYITVPNNHCRRVIKYGRRTGLDYLTLDNTGNFPMHLNFYTAKSLAHMLREAGLEPLQVKTRPLDELPAAQITERDETQPSFYGTNPKVGLFGGELFMLAGKPANTTAKRTPELDRRIEDAFLTFHLLQARERQNQAKTWEAAAARASRDAKAWEAAAARASQDASEALSANQQLSSTIHDQLDRIAELQTELASLRTLINQRERDARRTRWLLARLGEKVRHFPRDLSRRVRASQKKKRR